MFGVSPWRLLREQPHLTVLWTSDLPDDVLGVALFDYDAILLAKGMSQADRRCVLEHERTHLARGPVMPHLEQREERAVDLEVARRLIPFDALVDAMLWSGDDYEVAEQLTVAVDLVRVRLHNLTETETIALNHALDEGELRLP